MKELRVALIGTGDISHRHMKVWKHIPQAKVIAAAEIDEKKLAAFGEQYGVTNLYKDFREMLKRDDIDAVDVCVHNNLHTPVAMAVLKAGIPCYSEKPMSASYADSKLLYDCAKATGVKFAVQISSLFSAQTLIAKKLLDAGRLGNVYTARSITCNYRRRPCVDRPTWMISPAFQDVSMAGYGPIIDQGIYSMGQMIYLLGLPELESVYGTMCKGVDLPKPGSQWAKDHPLNVEDFGAGIAKFKGGLAVEFLQATAFNVEEVGKSYIAGSRGALEYSGIDQFGGDWSFGGPNGELPPFLQPTLVFRGADEFGFECTIDYRPYLNQQDCKLFLPESLYYFDNQMMWYGYVTGELTEEQRYDTPTIALNASLIAEGLVMSNQLGRSVSAEEIKAESKSLAIWHQETPWGTFDYDSTY